MSSASSSTTSLISGSSFSSTSTKDYAAAFANLQSSFGYGGMAPRVVPKKPKFVQPLPYDAPVAPVPAAIGSRAHAQAPAAKKFEAAFGALSSQFGTGAGSVSKFSST